MRRAVIDIGTNTVKLLVADVDGDLVDPIRVADRTTRLGQGADRAGRLLPEPIERTVAAVAEYAAEARRLGATDIRAVTTSAAREAANSAELLDAVRSRCALDIEILEGVQEARLVYRAVAADPLWTGQPLLVVDVGGGSAEFIQGQGRRIQRQHCLPVGAVRLLERFGDESLDRLDRFLRDCLGGALSGYRRGPARMIATGGTAVTLANIAGHERQSAGAGAPLWLPPAVLDHNEISLERLQTLIGRLHRLPLPKRRRVPGLPPERADIIVAGAMVFLVSMKLLHAPTLLVSIRSLRHGLLLEAAG